ncbi:uncharacterized protein LOC143036922 isoform X1 [Oratosquilla oratoria]|uniref:uncharacterized protein LOC143036922 isoform X1 n=1 Tax=Oratosquilla oratoria TaxID=337810 RepID=UPI003F776AD3
MTCHPRGAKKEGGRDGEWNIYLNGYVLAVGALLSGGKDYSSSLANILLALATVRAPDPLPMNGVEIVAFMVAATVGHILLITTALSIIGAAAPLWKRIRGGGCGDTK